MHARRFVANRHKADAVRLQGSQEWIDFGAWQAKDELYALVGHGAGEQLAASYVSH